MAPRKQTPHRDEQDPVLPEIVVAVKDPVSTADVQSAHGEATEGSNQQQATRTGNHRTGLIGNRNASESDASCQNPTRAKAPLLTRELADTASKSVSKKVTDKSSKSAGPHAQQQDPKESQPEVQEVDDRADASGGTRRRRATTASDTQKPWTGRAKPKRVYCPACTKRKSEPGENGHPRQNAIHKCPDCAELTRKGASEQPEQSRGKKKEAGKSAEPEPERSQSEECERREGHEGELAFLRSSARCIYNDGGAKWGSDQPEQSAPGKRKLHARPHKPRQEQDNGSGLSTQSDDPDSPPTPNDDNPLVDDAFGSRGHFSDPGPSSSPDVSEVAPGFFSAVQDPPPAAAWPVHTSLIDPALLEGERLPELRRWSGNPMLTGKTPPLTVEQAPSNSGPVLTGNNNENSGDNYGNGGGWTAAEAAAEAEDMFKPYIYPEP